MHTCIEDFSTELWFMIFRFLTSDQIISAFSQLNSRFDFLLSSPHLPTLFRVKIDRADAYPTVHTLRQSKHLELEWIQKLETNERTPGAYLIQFLRYQTHRLINLRSLNISLRAKHISTNFDHLRKSLSQLHSLRVLKLQCEQRYVDRTISYSLAQLFQTILQLPLLKDCTLHLWNISEKNFDYETIIDLPSNQSIEYLHLTGIDRTLLFTLLTRCHRLKSLTVDRNAPEDMLLSTNPYHSIFSNLSYPTLSTITLSICNLRFDQLENICTYAASRIRHLRLHYSVYVFTNHYEDYLDYFDQTRWTKLLERIDQMNISIEIHAFDDVAKDIVGSMTQMNPQFTWNEKKGQSSYACLSIKN